MKPVNFPQQTIVLGKPADMTDEQCGSLPVFSNGQECISCWELSPEEIAELLVTHRVWIRILSGESQPPILPQIEHPFENSE